MLNLINILKKIYWFVVRPKYYFQFIFLIIKKINLKFRRKSIEKNLNWCIKNSVSTNEAILQLTGKNFKKSIYDLYPNTFLKAKNKIKRSKNNIVLSRKAALEQVNSEQKEKLLSSIKEGSVLKGTVKNLTDYGAFIDLGGLDGLLHITDMSWSRVNHPSEIVNIGDKLEVKVIKFTEEDHKISLGVKQLSEDPWVGIESKLPVNTSCMAKVTNITDYGFFAEIELGVEGLVHVSEIDWTNKNIHPSKVVNLEDTLEVMILEVDEEKRRISLGMKQLSENPWQVFAHKHKE